jgi:DNA-binding NtrC family response regulator
MWSWVKPLSGVFMSVRVLDVGQCGFDGPRIAAFCRQVLHATVEHCDTASHALKRVSESKFDLVLVNRVLDQDGSSGLDLIRDLLASGDVGSVMLISNYADAQEAAVALGAKRGFGKSALSRPESAELLKQSLARQTETGSRGG